MGNFIGACILAFAVLVAASAIAESVRELAKAIRDTAVNRELPAKTTVQKP